MLIIVALGMAYMLYQSHGHGMVVLNLFYLPIVLAAYYLGRTHAGVLALLCVLATTIVITIDSTGLTGYSKPTGIALALTIWGACLGLTSILVGTLCDERAKTVEELHVAYVGVVEVLSRYLQSANPSIKARATRIAELCQQIATRLNLPRREIDNLRVAALLYDLGNIEITTQLLTKAVDTVEAGPKTGVRNTFSGMDLAQSLGSVLSGALPLLVTQDDAARQVLDDYSESGGADVPIGAKIICAARAFDAFTQGLVGDEALSPEEAVQEMRMDIAAGYDTNVLAALEHCAGQSQKTGRREPALAGNA